MTKILILESNSGPKNYLINELYEKIDKKLIFTLFLLGFMALSQISLAQFPPPPPSGDKGGSTNGVPGGGAPIGSGVVLLISLAAGYGGKKVFDFGKHKQAE